MSDLDSYVKNSAKFLTIEDGETVTLIYKGYSIVDDRFNPGNKTVSYLFQYPDSNKTIPWTKSSRKVASQMKRINVGDTVTITRMGEGMSTTYRVKPVGKPLSTMQDDETIPF